jgi:hypothetical protein
MRLGSQPNSYQPNASQKGPALSLKGIFFGKPKDPLDPRVFHQVSLIAFLAWVGLGADGLSSSAYGPEEAYLALGEHFFLALPLAILMATTVFVISASYSHIIELFPTGGGGFIDGPRVLSNMAVDSWVPHRFSHLSDHLVTRYGIWFMGLASLTFLAYTAGDVRLLVVMYAINVFVTFSLSQLGMCRHWWEVRKNEKGWLRKLFVNGLGLSFTATILIVTVFLKFAEGGWVTLLVTSGFIVLCYIVRLHYDQVRGALKSLDDALINIPFHPDLKNPVPARNPDAPTAILIVRDFDGLAIHSLLSIGRLFPNHFKNIVFVSVGVIDSGRFKGVAEIENLRRLKEEDLKSFVEFANCLGWYAEYRYSLGIDLIEELEKLCKSVAKDFPRSVFFAGRLVFERENLFTRLLHNHTPFTLEQRLQFEGLEMMILPIRVFARA